MENQTIDPDLEQILQFLSDVIKKLIERLKDGFQPLPDIMAMIPSLMGGQEAYEGNENAWKYLSQLNDTKLDETVSSIMAKIGETSEEMRNVIKYPLKTLGNGYMSYLAFKALQAARAKANSGQPQG